MKKAIIVVLSIVGLLVLIAVIAPFVVDLNRFRPVIKRIVEEKINGTFDIDEVDLTIFSGFGVKLAGVTVRNGQKFREMTFFRVERVKIRVPLLSIITGLSHASVFIESPYINLAKNEDGDLNLKDLLNRAIDFKPAKSEQKQPEEEISGVKEGSPPAEGGLLADSKESSQAQGTEKEASPLEAKVLALMSRVAIDVDIREADFSYEDLPLKSTKKIEKVNLKLTNVRPGEKFAFAMESSIDIPDSGVSGKIGASGDITADIKEGRPEITVEGRLGADSLLISIPAVVEKTREDPFSIEFLAVYKDFKLKLEASVDLRISRLIGREFGDIISVKTRVNSNLSDEYIPVYSDLSVKFISKGSDVNLRAKVSNLDNIEFEVSSNYFRADDFIEPPPTLMAMLVSKEEKKSGEESIEPGETETESGEGEEETREAGSEKEPGGSGPDYFAEIREDPYYLGLKVTGDINFTRIIAARTEIKNLLATVNLNKLKLFSSCTLNVFRGNVNIGQLILNVRGRRPLFNIDATILGIDLEPAVPAFVGLKDLAKGKFKGSFEFTGAGVDADTVKKTIHGNAHFEGTGVQIRAFNVMEGLKREVGKSAFLEKLDLSKYSFDEGVDRVLLDFSLKNAKAYVKNLELFRRKQYLLRLAGQSTFEPLLDFSGDLRVVPPLSTTVVRSGGAGSILLNREKELVVPFYLRGPFTDLKYGVDMDRLNALYGKKIRGHAVEKAKAVLKNRKVQENAKKQILKKVPGKHRDGAKKLFKKFGF